MSDVTDLTRGFYRRQYSGFIFGQRINKLCIEAEAWFWRVLAVVDDFGNGYADPTTCYNLTVGNRKGIKPQQVGKWLKEMAQVGLIAIYEVKGEYFLHIEGFEQMQPAGKNGKRLKRYPLASEGESRIIQNNPDVSSASHNHTHNQDQDQDHNQDQSRASQARAVFDCWKTALNHPKAKLDKKRLISIQARLRDGYSVDDLSLAIQGCKASPYYMGQNERNTVYDDISLICRDAKHVDQFIARVSNGNSNGRRPPQFTPNDAVEVCERCNNTGTENTPKGSRPCQHNPL